MLVGKPFVICYEAWSVKFSCPSTDQFLSDGETCSTKFSFHHSDQATQVADMLYQAVKGYPNHVPTRHVLEGILMSLDAGEVVGLSDRWRVELNLITIKKACALMSRTGIKSDSWFFFWGNICGVSLLLLALFSSQGCVSQRPSSITLAPPLTLIPATRTPSLSDTASTARVIKPFSISILKKTRLYPGQTQNPYLKEAAISDLGFSPDGETVAMCGAAGSGLYRLDTLDEIWHVSTGIAVNSIAFSSTGSFLAAGSDNKTVVLLNAENGKSLRKLEGFSDWVGSVAFTASGRYLAAGSFQTIMVWDTTTWSALPALKGHSSYIWNLAFSPAEDNLLTSASVDNTIILWDVAFGQQLRTLRGPTYWMRSVAFSPDGRLIASGSGDGNVLLWDAASGEQVFTLRAHRGYIWDVAFSPDGLVLATASEDQTVILWDFSALSGGAGGNSDNFTSVVLKEHPSGVRSLAFSPDGSILAAGSDDGTLVLWAIRK